MAFPPSDLARVRSSIHTYTQQLAQKKQQFIQDLTKCQQGNGSLLTILNLAKLSFEYPIKSCEMVDRDLRDIVHQIKTTHNFPAEELIAFRLDLVKCSLSCAERLQLHEAIKIYTSRCALGLSQEALDKIDFLREEILFKDAQEEERDENLFASIRHYLQLLIGLKNFSIDISIECLQAIEQEIQEFDPTFGRPYQNLSQTTEKSLVDQHQTRALELLYLIRECRSNNGSDEIKELQKALMFSLQAAICSEESLLISFEDLTQMRLEITEFLESPGGFQEEYSEIYETLDAYYCMQYQIAGLDTSEELASSERIRQALEQFMQHLQEEARALKKLDSFQKELLAMQANFSSLSREDRIKYDQLGIEYSKVMKSFKNIEEQLSVLFQVLEENMPQLEFSVEKKDHFIALREHIELLALLQKLMDIDLSMKKEYLIFSAKSIQVYLDSILHSEGESSQRSHAIALEILGVVKKDIEYSAPLLQAIPRISKTELEENLEIFFVNFNEWLLEPCKQGEFPSQEAMQEVRRELQGLLEESASYPDERPELFVAIEEMLKVLEGILEGFEGNSQDLFECLNQMGSDLRNVINAGLELSIGDAITELDEIAGQLEVLRVSE